MKKIYINTKTSFGVETLEEVNKNDFKTKKEFNQELNSLLQNYSLMGMNVYKSQRCSKDWR